MDELKAPPAETQANHRSGFVTLLGRSNVGKSTLLNQVLGQKVAIVTPKPQTTRGRILGVKTMDAAQLIFIDTPGLHDSAKLLNRRIVEVAERAWHEADVLVWVVDAAAGLTTGDRRIAARLAEERRPVCVAANKMDRMDRPALLPILAAVAAVLPNRDVVPVSALTGANLEALLRVVAEVLPPGPRLYDPETVTDQTERMLAQEAVREQVLLQTADEVPYSVAVSIDAFEDKATVTVIKATIHVERASQKGILIGHRGRRIREIGRAARVELERILERRVFLELFVRVQEGWTTREGLLREFGL